MEILANVRILDSALKVIRKGALIVTDSITDGIVSKQWIEKSEHTHGYDHVLFRVVNGQCTLYSTNAIDYDECREWRKSKSLRDKGLEKFEGATCTFVRLTCHVEGDGSFAVPVRVIHDYVKTFAPSADLLIRIVDGKLQITQGRNRCNIVGKAIEDMPFAFEDVAHNEPVEEPIKVTYNPVYHYPTAEEQRASAEREQEAYYESMTGATCDWFAPAMHGPAFVPKPRVRWSWVGYCSPWQPRPARRNIRDTMLGRSIAQQWQERQERRIGECCEWHPRKDRKSAPTPIKPRTQYTPAVGDTVFLVLRHENGTTTDRVVNVTRVANDGHVFRGFDRRYNHTRNFQREHIAHIEKWDGSALYDRDGKEVTLAA